MTRSKPLITPGVFSFFGFDINDPPSIHKVFNPFSKGVTNFGFSLILIGINGFVEVPGYNTRELHLHMFMVVQPIPKFFFVTMNCWSIYVSYPKYLPSIKIFKLYK